MTEEQQARFRQYVDQQQVLLAISQRIAEGAHLGEVIPGILDMLTEAIPAGCVRLLVAPPGAKSYAFGRGPLSDAGAVADVALLDLTAQHGTIKLVQGDDAPFDTAFLPPDFFALTALPLFARGDSHGVLWLGFDAPHMLGDAEYTLLEILAAQVAVAIANARALAAARQRHEWLAAVLAHTPDAVLVMDRDLRLQLANPAAQELFPSLDHDVIGMPLDRLHEIQGLSELFSGLAAGDGFNGGASDAGEAGPVEYTLDDDRTFAPSVSAVLNDDGEQTGWVLVLQDITRFKRLHDNMTDFLSTVSHDMRSPLTFMKGYLDMVGMVGDLNDKQGEFVGKIATGFDQITDMVEKILKAGRLDPMTGTYRLEREPCDVVEMLNEVVGSLSGPAQEKGLHLTHTVDDGLPVLNLDRGLIVSAFMNLAENAVKYTPEGGHIDIDLRRRGDELLFRVRDDGYGISPEDQKKLFRRNVRIHRKEWKRVKGSGLGLFIVKNVAQRHGGDTWVESAEGEGSTFYFSIPLAGANLLGGEG